MRKYNKKILTALVIAYKKGIINKEPLNRWTNYQDILQTSLKYLTYFTIFCFLFIYFNYNGLSTNELSDVFAFSGLAFNKARMISGISLGFMILVLFLFGKYLAQIFIVNTAMKKYHFNNSDIEILNKITYKIHL